MIPPRKPPQEENVDSWLMSYADMITLLLCFFIIFVSVSEPKRDRLSAVTEGMATRFGAISMATPFQGIYRSLLGVVEEKRVLQDVAIERGDRSITMEISSLSFFKPESAEFSEAMLPVLEALATPLKNASALDYRVVIEGHTNDLPVSSPSYPSNWELSAARAARVARFLIAAGVKADHIKVVGYAGTKPKVPNLDTGGNAILANRKQNERVVILIEQGL